MKDIYKRFIKALITILIIVVIFLVIMSPNRLLLKIDGESYEITLARENDVKEHITDEMAHEIVNKVLSNILYIYIPPLIPRGGWMYTIDVKDDDIEMSIDILDNHHLKINNRKYYSPSSLLE